LIFCCCSLCEFFTPREFSHSSNYAKYVIKLKKISLKVHMEMSLLHQTHQASPSAWYFVLFKRIWLKIAILLSNEEIHAKRKQGREVNFFIPPTTFAEINSWKIHFSKVFAWIVWHGLWVRKCCQWLRLFVCETSLLLNPYFFARSNEGVNITTLTYNWDITARKERNWDLVNPQEE
jgi:hypothetical protein